MGIGCLGPEKCHLHGLLKGKRGRDDLAKNPADTLVGERTFVLRNQSFEDGLFPARHIINALIFVLGLADGDHEFRASIQQIKNLIIEGVDLLTQILQLLFVHKLSSFPNFGISEFIP